ncbi:hypothetical protein J2Y46_002615 [Microbacterium sp. BE35]|uniref:hypothetical protein n=1 Tax=Microbacterium sp. BE35 TaxID=2817773 RepID=UPI00285B7787|nr:hypothetical protein [Microbacterium sp. BE35]MDR7189789.1 hypothetical protein [Microbacterium sp. BE35]
MPTTNARKHVIPSGTDASVSRDTIFKEFGESIRDVVPVANTTARATLVSDLTAAGEAPSSTKPLVVYRHDAPGLHRLEYTVDGTVWIPSSGVLAFASTGARDTWTTSNSAYLASGDRCRIGVDEYRWTGSAWAAGSGGMFRLTPGSVNGSGVSIGANGDVILTAVPASTAVQIRDIFSTNFRDYRIMSKFSARIAAGGYTVQGMVSTTVIGGTSYSHTRVGVINGGAVTGGSNVAQSHFGDPMVGDAGSMSASTMDVIAANAAEATMVISNLTLLGGSTGALLCSGNLNSTDQLTGLQLNCPSGGTTTGVIRVFGVT